MSTATVLVIDPDKAHVGRVRQILLEESYDVIAAVTGDAGLEIALRHRPDLVVLEVNLPGTNGFEICRRLGSAELGSRIPVIILSTRGAELDRVLGLELGADDYMTKPFSPRELAARVKALLRRVSMPAWTGDIRRSGDLLLDRGRREVSLQGRPIALTAVQFKILESLMSCPGRVFSRNDLLGTIYTDDLVVLDRMIDVHICAIRRKLGTDCPLIQTVRGFGYRIQDAERLTQVARCPEGSGASHKVAQPWLVRKTRIHARA